MDFNQMFRKEKTDPMRGCERRLREECITA
jgi:hypothetical protein